MPKLRPMSASTVSVSEKSDLPFNQSLQTQSANLLLAYTRREINKLEAVSVTATVATSQTCALSTVIVVERLPWIALWVMQVISQAATLIYLSFA
jgi:hypothetical protein